MSFESLSHTPEFELPPNAPGAPADLISLIEECYEGLWKAIVTKMIRRGKYDQISVVICQDNPSKKTTPSASAEDIAEYCMMCMQYEIDKSDEPGTYKVELIGPPGKGRFQRSKHIDLGDGDGMARSKTMMSEGELVEQMSQYIGELHSQSIAVLETLHGMVKPLLQENKEMMKIQSDSTRRLAEVERDRLRFDLEMRIHADEQKMDEQKEDAKNQRWSETMEVVKESGAVEGFMKALLKKLNRDDSDTDEKEEKEEPKKKKKREKEEESSGESEPKKKKKKKKGKKKKKDGESRVGKAKKKKRGDKKSEAKSPVSEGTQKAIEDGEEMTQEQMEEVFQASAMERVRDNPTSLMVEVLKMSIDENDQWEMIEETLNPDQLVLFKKILDCEDDTKIEKLLKRLYNMKGSRRLMKLESSLEDDQKAWVEKLFEIATS